MLETPSDLFQPFANASEEAVRVQLAAVCHMIENFGWSDAILNHVSARVPSHNDRFIMNPYGLMYQEITASKLVKVDYNGTNIDKSPWSVNMPGLVLHAAIYEARPDITSIIHTHTPYGVAISILECGLRCTDQMAMLFEDRVGYHDFEGILISPDEKAKIAKNLGRNKCLILRNHGLVATGRSIAEAFWNYYYLEFACKVQVLAMSTGSKIKQVPKETRNHAYEQHEFFCQEKAPTVGQTFPGNCDMMLHAFMRMLDRKGCDYRS